jgi:hypothetical protein
MMRLTLLAVGLGMLLFVGGAAQGGVPCPITEPTLATPCPNPRPASPIDLQLIVEPSAKGLGPLRGGQSLALVAYVASRLSIITEVTFWVNDRLVGRQPVTIRANCPLEGPVCIIGTQSVQVNWTAEPGQHLVTARLLTLSRSLPVNILSAALREGLDFAPEELLVQFKPEATPAQIEEIIARLRTQVIQVFALSQIYHLRILDRLPVAEKVAQFGREALVQFAEPNGQWYFQQQPNDPYFPAQWNLHNTGQRHPSADKFLIFGGSAQGTAGADIGAMRAWAQVKDSSALVIALLDSGVAPHPELRENLWPNSKDELAGWSSWGARTVDLAAPGEDIVGLLIERPDNFLKLPRTRALPELSSWLAVAGGTSYAAAHVTGLSALLWARCPTKSALEIRNLILNAVEKKSAFAGKVASGGRLRWPESLAC